MAYERENLEKLYERLTIEDEDDTGVIVGVEDGNEKKESFVLVGRFLTEKNINFPVMQSVLASLWRPKEGMEIHDIGGYRYSFVFFHIMDLRKVIEGGPWSFEQNLLVYHKMQEMEDAHQVVLNEVEVWVQVHDIPKGFISENILMSIGGSIGKYVKSDSANFDGTWKAYVRIRVILNIEKPLKRRMKIKREGGNWSWVNFKYERMGNFCFVCGIIGHTESECSVVYANPDKEVERAYGPWLRASGRGGKYNAGARWLRNSEGGSSWATAGGGGWKQTKGSTGAKESTRFTENAGVMRETRGDNDTVVVTAKNQEAIEKEGRIMTVNEENNQENLNFVMETKRKRVENTQDGPMFMQTDGPNHEGTNNQIRLNDPKNLQGAGSGIQTRREL